MEARDALTLFQLLVLVLLSVKISHWLGRKLQTSDNPPFWWLVAVMLLSFAANLLNAGRWSGLMLLLPLLVYLWRRLRPRLATQSARMANRLGGALLGGALALLLAAQYFNLGLQANLIGAGLAALLGAGLGLGGD